MKPTAKQIELSKQIWEAGVRIEIYIGMFVLYQDTIWIVRVRERVEHWYSIPPKIEYTKNYRIDSLQDTSKYIFIQETELIPILDFEDAVKELGKYLDWDWETYAVKEYMFYKENIEIPVARGDGKTRTEAILSCLLEVARKAKGGE